MKLSKFLKYTDFIGLSVIIYSANGNEMPLFSGSVLDIPWWIADLKIAKPWNKKVEESISYRTSLGEEYDNKPGLVITVIDE